MAQRSKSGEVTRIATHVTVGTFQKPRPHDEGPTVMTVTRMAAPGNPGSPIPVTVGTFKTREERTKNGSFEASKTTTVTRIVALTAPAL